MKIKKILLSTVLAGLITTSYANTDVENKLNKLNIFNGYKIENVQKVKDLNSGAELYRLSIKSPQDKTFTAERFIIKNGDYLTFESIDLKSGKLIVEAETSKAVNSALLELIKNDDSVVRIGNDKNKKTLYTLVDGDCPYCQDEMVKIKQTLKKYNVAVVLAPFPNTNQNKLALIEDEIKNNPNMSDMDKIALLKKYVSRTNPSAKASEDTLKELRKRAFQYIATEKKYKDTYGRPYMFVSEMQ